jgi:hypothetical protein
VQNTAGLPSVGGVYLLCLSETRRNSGSRAVALEEESPGRKRAPFWLGEGSWVVTGPGRFLPLLSWHRLGLRRERCRPDGTSKALPSRSRETCRDPVL